eukprot:SAG31_NODE_46297_length_255_cov_0.660256_1_plen_40_part_01
MLPRLTLRPHRTTRLDPSYRMRPRVNALMHFVFLSAAVWW